MAITSKQLLNYSWMSQASYLDFTGLLTSDPIDKFIGKLEASIKGTGVELFLRCDMREEKCHAVCA